eukprot:3105276-Amphidinium_carterae.2
MRQNYGHLGIVRGKKDDFAIRACKELTTRIRNSLGQYSERLWRVANLPPALEVEDMKDILAQIKWNATLMDHSKTCRRGMASWNVRSEHLPPAYAFPLTCGHQRFSMKIYDPRVVRTAKEAKAPERELGSKTWIDALKGNHIKELTDKIAVATGDNVADDREGWHDKPPRSNRATPERPAKKLRHAGADEGEEPVDDDMDDDECDGECEALDDGEQSADSDGLSEEESLGFGTDVEDATQVEEALAPRSLQFGRPKRAAKKLATDGAVFDGRVANVEAAVGRMEAIMASLMAQQQQQQHFMQQVQAHLSQTSGGATQPAEGASS